MKLIMENWRYYEDWHVLEEELKLWLIAEGYYTHEEMLLLNEGRIGDAWNWVKGKLQDAKDWTYEQYVKFVKPLLAKLKGFIQKLKQKGVLKKYAARFKMHAIDLFLTKKYIKLGAVFLSGLVKIIFDQVLELPKKIKILSDALTALQQNKTKAAAELLGIPYDEIKELVGGIVSFGGDLKKTYGSGSDKIGQGEFELAKRDD